jgi:hypothetical protein
MTQQIIEQMSDAVDLANHLYKTAQNSEDKNEKRNNLRYLGQCLSSMKKHIDDSRERIKDTEECKC